MKEDGLWLEYLLLLKITELHSCGRGWELNSFSRGKVYIRFRNIFPPVIRGQTSSKESSMKNFRCKDFRLEILQSWQSTRDNQSLGGMRYFRETIEWERDLGLSLPGT